MAHSHNSTDSTTPLSVRVSLEVRNQLEQLAISTGRTKSFLAAEAIEGYLASHAWQVKSVEKAVKKANSKNAKFIEHRKVADWLSTWGNEEEQEPPR